MKEEEKTINLVPANTIYFHLDNEGRLTVAQRWLVAKYYLEIYEYLSYYL